MDLFGDVGSSGYGAPSSGYGAPSSSYGAPAPSYSAPAPSYSAPSSGYGAPSSSYSSPSTGYNTPSTSFNTGVTNTGVTNTGLTGSGGTLSAPITTTNGGALYGSKNAQIYQLGQLDYLNNLGNIDYTDDTNGNNYVAQLLDVNNLLGGNAVQYQRYNPYITAYQYQQKWFLSAINVWYFQKGDVKSWRRDFFNLPKL